MVTEIRQLYKDDLESLVGIVDRAYPEPEQDREQRRRWLMTELDEHNAGVFYGAFSGNNELLGAMGMYDLRLNLRSVKVCAGGVGYVCTHFLHKKEKVAKSLISFFLEYYRQKGVNVVMLYPFNIPFYKKMGFGFAARMHQFRVKPGCFPGGASKNNLRYVDESHRDALLECYNRYVDRTNGMIEKREVDIRNMFDKDNSIVAFLKEGRISGYVVFHFRKVHPDCYFMHDMVVTEFVYDTREALMELCTFFSSQADQINRIILNTPDDDMYYLLGDPSNDSNDAFGNILHEVCDTAVGPMYRVVNVQGIFKELCSHRFGNFDITLKITVNDSLLRINSGSTVITFEKGRAGMSGDEAFDAEIILDISEFSSILTGGIDFRTLYNYGLAEISDSKYVDMVSELFMYENKPKCTIYF